MHSPRQHLPLTMRLQDYNYLPQGKGLGLKDKEETTHFRSPPTTQIPDGKMSTLRKHLQFLCTSTCLVRGRSIVSARIMLYNWTTGDVTKVCMYLSTNHDHQRLKHSSFDRKNEFHSSRGYKMKSVQYNRKRNAWREPQRVQNTLVLLLLAKS